MAAPEPLPAPTGPPAGGPPDARAVVERQMGMLMRLADLGMAVAEAAAARATAPAAEPSPGEADPALAFSRAARTVRLTIALQSRVMKDLAGLDDAAVLARKAEAGKARHRVFRGLEQAVDAACEDAGEADEMFREARERLSDTEDEDILGASPAEIVTRICADLGLAADWGADGRLPPLHGAEDRNPTPSTVHAAPRLDPSGLRTPSG